MASAGFQYRVKDGRAEAYLSNPESRRPLGQAIVVHEVWGLTDFIREACDGLSRHGLTAVAPMLYWRHKDLFTEETIREGLKTIWGLTLEERRIPARLDAAIKKGRPSKEAAAMLRILYDSGFRALLSDDLLSLARSLARGHPDLPVGSLGFSFGGRLALQLSSAYPRLAACVAVSSEPLVGPPLAKVRCPILLLYGAKDSFMLRHLPAFVSEAVENGNDLRLRIYPSAGHEFFDHTDEKDFNPEAAANAWEETTAFMIKHLAERR